MVVYCILRYMCLILDILYWCRTRIQMNRGLKMLEILMIASFTLLGAYSVWYIFKAKTYQSMTLDDLALMWKAHKQKTGCNASYIETLLLKNNEVVGYKCSCGKSYYQKRLITQRAQRFTQNKLLSAAGKRFTGIFDLDDSMNKMGLKYSHIKKI